MDAGHGKEGKEIIAQKWAKKDALFGSVKLTYGVVGMADCLKPDHISVMGVVGIGLEKFQKESASLECFGLCVVHRVVGEVKAERHCGQSMEPARSQSRGQRTFDRLAGERARFGSA